MLDDGVLARVGSDAGRQGAVVTPAGLVPAIPPEIPADDDLVVERRVVDPAAWCEALPAAAGRTILISGRVIPATQGGLETATTLARHLRMAVRGLARVDLAPAEALGHLDAIITEWDEPFQARLLYGVFDPVDGAFCFAQAGHPAPVICRPKGAASAQPPPEGGLLGGFVSMSAAYGEQTIAVPPGGTLLIALPAESTELETAAEGLAAGLATDLCDPVSLADLVAPQAGAVLVAGWPSGLSVGPVRVIELELGEGEDPTRRARAFCYGVLSTWQLSALVRDDIVLAVSELVANALLYGGAAEQLRLRRTANRVVIEVFDREPSMPRPRIADADAESGRGLFLVRRVARRWGARAVPGGKAVWCEFDLTAPAGEEDDSLEPAACG